AKKKQQDLDKQQKDLKKMKDDLERQAQLLQESVRRQKARDYQNKLMALQEAYVAHQKELKAKEAKLLKPIFDKLTATIATIAKEKKYSVVLEKNAGVLYSADALDITDEVIKRYGK
ncbi:MAG: outer membrane protein, partial [Myxococcota bacterium]